MNVWPCSELKRGRMGDAVCGYGILNGYYCGPALMSLALNHYCYMQYSFGGC